MILLVILLFAASLHAQPGAPEIYGSIGLLRGAGDESSFGTSAAYGAGVTVPLARKLAVDVDFDTARFERGPGFRLRRLLIRPGLLYRFGASSLYGYVGGGVGAEVSRTPASSWNERLYHARGGFVVSPMPHLVLRVDLSAGWVTVLPNLGLKLGIGYRF